MTVRRVLAFALLLLAVVTPAAAGDGYTRADHAAFEDWLAFGDRRVTYRDLTQTLVEAGVDDVVPPWHLLRQGTDYANLGEPAFAMPPRDMWSEMVPTLQVLRDEVIPRVGPVEVLSAFRTERYNARAGGASGSRHKWFEAVDVVPVQPWTRSRLHETLLDLWSTAGPADAMGLGLYSGVRFHVDTHRFRRW
ncbi:MAG: hypothetical protein H6739_41765 [Alphaproteobacteria bacterium]|nr:hypothetical protein [Alphaproteobacteria bacterium]